MSNETERRFRFSSVSDFRKSLFENWPVDWPSQEFHAIQHDVSVSQYEELTGIIRSKSGEREIESFLKRNREVLALVTFMYSTGHHMAWIFPKHHIRPPSGHRNGLIPDYLLAGASSMGVEWFLLELKGADEKAFARRGDNVYLSSAANSGVCQLLNYIDISDRDQSYLRDGLKLPGFREPRGILLIGTDDETDEDKVREFKGAWNRINSKVQIRSYNALLRQVEGKLRDFGKL
jgi:hypothetical protein